MQYKNRLVEKKTVYMCHIDHQESLYFLQSTIIQNGFFQNKNTTILKKTYILKSPTISILLVIPPQSSCSLQQVGPFQAATVLHSVAGEQFLQLLHAETLQFGETTELLERYAGVRVQGQGTCKFTKYIKDLQGLGKLSEEISGVLG